MNYNILELVLSYVCDFRKLIRLTCVDKSWLDIIKTNKIIWDDVEIDIKLVHKNKNNLLLYPIRWLLTDNDTTDNLLCESLIKLDIRGMSKIKNEVLSKCVNLKSLKCSMRHNNSAINSLTNLVELNLSRSAYINGYGLHNLVKLQTLICGRSTSIMENDLTHLTNLTTLKLNGSITNRMLSKMTTLTSLDLRYETYFGTYKIITDEGIKKLYNLKKLYCDDLITNEGIKDLCNLEILDITNCNKLTNQALTYLPKLQVLIRGGDTIKFNI
jgi:hypothetical protein